MWSNNNNNRCIPFTNIPATSNNWTDMRDTVNCNRPINISVSNTGNTGNPFVNWTPSTGNFGNTGNPTTNISTFNPPNMNIPTGSTQSFGNNVEQNSTQVITRYQNLMKGFTGQVLGGANHDKRHCRDYSEKPQVNKEMLAAVRMIDSKNNPKAVNFILFHDCYLNDDDMYWLTSVFNTHKSNIAVNTIDLSNNCISLTPTKNMPFFSFNYPFYTTWNVLRLDLSNNNIGDDGAKCIADGLSKGFFPITKQINLSGNQITDTGKEQLATAVNKSQNPNLAITLEKQNDAGGVWDFIKKAFNYYAKEHSNKLAEDGKAALAVYGDNKWTHCKKLINDTSKEMSMGVVKHSSNVIAQQLLQKAPPQIKGATIGTIFIAAGIDTALSIDVENLGYCIAAVNSTYGYSNKTELVGDNGETESF